MNVDPEKPWDLKRWDFTTKVVAGLIVTAGGYYVAHLERMPETGRLRFMDASPAFEVRMAKEAHAELEREFRGRILPPNHPTTKYVRDIVVKILESSNLGTLKSDPHFIAPAGISIEDTWAPDAGRKEDAVPGSGGREWELMVVHDDKMVNAMATFGNIVVFTGILPIAKDRDGLAAVLGHEIGHVVARHQAERYSSMKVLLGIATLLQFLGLDFGISRLVTTILLELPNGRTQELEADKIGLRLASQACFKPDAAPQMFSRLDALEKSRGGLNISFLQTHPATDSRMKKLNELLPEAYSIQAASPACAGTQDHFRAFVDSWGI